jgi:hypothetical protein
LLVSRGANIHSKNLFGDTPLHRAAWKNHAPTCALLLKLGAQRDVKNNDGKTPLDLARTLDVKQLVAPLVDVGMLVVADFLSSLFLTLFIKELTRTLTKKTLIPIKIKRPNKDNHKKKEEKSCIIVKKEKSCAFVHPPPSTKKKKKKKREKTRKELAFFRFICCFQ